MYQVDLLISVLVYWYIGVLGDKYHIANDPS